MKKILSLLHDQNKNFKIFAIIFSIYCALILGISWDENYYKDIKAYDPFLEDFDLDKNKIRYILMNIFGGK